MAFQMPICLRELKGVIKNFDAIFSDGNGRTARLLMNQILMAAGYPYINIKVQNRLEYYRVLDEASKGDILEFERFLADQMEITLGLYLECTGVDQIEDVEKTKTTTDKIENYRDTIEL